MCVLIFDSYHDLCINILIFFKLFVFIFCCSVFTIYNTCVSTLFSSSLLSSYSSMHCQMLCVFVTYNIRSAYFRCLLSSRNLVGIISTSALSALIDVVLNAPATCLIILFCIVCMSLMYVCWLRNHTSDP